MKDGSIDRRVDSKERKEQKPSRAFTNEESEDELVALSSFFKIIGDRTRLGILCSLFHSELCVIDIGKELGMSKSAVSHQLRTLKEYRLVTSRRDGKNVFYSLCDDHVRTIVGMGLEHIKE